MFKQRGGCAASERNGRETSLEDRSYTGETVVHSGLSGAEPAPKKEPWMPRALSIAIFLSVFVSLLGLVHYYIWARLVRDLVLPQALYRWLTVIIVTLLVSLPAGFLLSRAGDWARPLVWASYLWMGTVFLLLVTVGLSDLVRAGVALVSQAASDGAPADPARRTFLSRLAGGFALVLAGGASVAAVRSGLSRVSVKTLEVGLRRLPQALSGSTIVQLSDIHVGPTIRRDFIEQIVETTNALEPDVIAITGDLVDGSVESLREHVAPLGGLRAKFGVFFVTGNHEYYSGVEEWCAELRRLGIRVLRNERVSIGHGDESYDLAGVDDFNAAPDLERALAGRDPARELVLLAHQPRAVREAAERGVGLQLSGHTHGGQIWPWRYMVYLQQPVVSGLAKIKETLLYVSNGTGYWGPPMRLAAPAEITQIRLNATAHPAGFLTS
jgi:predicted MPP superfamily phosphohydrolase